MRILIFATNHFLEHVRNRFVLISFFVALFLFALSLILGEMSFSEQKRMMIHFGFLAIYLTLLGLSLFLGSSVIQKEIERQTCLILLSRPVHRYEFLLGKFLGIVFLQVLIWAILGLTLVVLLNFNVPLLSFTLALVGILLEAILLLSIAMALGLWIKPAVALFASIGFFLVGHWQKDLVFFAFKSGDPVFIQFSKIVQTIFPQFYRLNYRSSYLVEKDLILESFFPSAIHALFWIGFFLTLSALLLRRKDLV